MCGAVAVVADWSFCESGILHRVLLVTLQTLDLIVGTAAPKTRADLFLWQVIGGGIATVFGPLAYTQQVRTPVAP